MSVAYAYDGVMYLAVTRRCTLHCTFCPKMNGRWVVAGNDLQHDPEPSAAELIRAAEEAGLAAHVDVAFVGLGEPTLRLDVVLEVGRALRAEGHRVRLVTDGLANLREGRDVTPELVGAIDEVHVSLNAADPASYVTICPSKYGEAAHAAVCAFIRAARTRLQVHATAIAQPGVDIPACKRLAQALGVPLRVRPYFDPRTGEPHEQGRQVE